MQKLDIPVSEHCLGQGESAETPACVLESGRQCPLGGAAMLCQEHLPGTFVVYYYYFSAQKIRAQSSCVSDKGSVPEPYPARQPSCLAVPLCQALCLLPENRLRSLSLIILDDSFVCLFPCQDWSPKLPTPPCPHSWTSRHQHGLGLTQRCFLYPAILGFSPRI